MNKTKIEWTDYTWNPVTGCKRGCFYCYARNINRRFNDCSYNEVLFHPKRLNKPSQIKKPSKIFVGSMCDLFADWTPIDWIFQILNVANGTPRHIFQFLTKNGDGYHRQRFGSRFIFTQNCWLGVTVTGEKKRNQYPKMHNNIFFISYEPLLGKITYIPEYCNWVIIGAITGNQWREIYKPKAEWIEGILKQAKRQKIPVFMKNNLKSVWKGKLKQEFPLSPGGKCREGQ